jgi:hypothetical protein
MLLRMGGDLSKLLTPDPAAVNMSGSLAGDSSVFTKGTGRPSEADWRAMSTLNRSSSDSSMRRSKDFNPSANHRQAKATAIGLRTADSAVGAKPKMPRAVRQTKDMGPLQGHSYSGDSQTQHSLNRSMASMASHTTPSSFEENEEIRHMVAERERNFFKDISMNPQLKDQHPLMHLISAEQKLRIVDEQSGVLMSNAAKGKKSQFGTAYGKQGEDKYSQYAVYAVDQPYIMKGKLIAPSEFRRQKEEKKAALLAIKEERIRKKKLRQAEMKMTGATTTDDAAGATGGDGVKHLAATNDGEISLVSAADSDEQVVDNSKSAKKHRDFLRSTLKEVEGEIVGAMDYIKVDKEAVRASKKEVERKSNVTNFEMVPTGHMHADLVEEVLDNEAPVGIKGMEFDRPGTTTSTAGRPLRSQVNTAGSVGSIGGGMGGDGMGSPGTTGYKADDMFSVQSTSFDGGNGSVESDLLKNWGSDRPLKSEAPAGI